MCTVSMIYTVILGSTAEPIYLRVCAIEHVKFLQSPVHRPEACLFRARLSRGPYAGHISLVTLVMISTGTWGELLVINAPA